MEKNGSQMITTAGSSHHGQTPMTERLELYGAALKNNWEAAEILIRRNPSLVRTPITNGGGTALHIAAIEGHQAFVTKLLQIMEVDDLKILNANGCTSLWSAAAAGHTRIAQIMVEASSTLPTIKGENGVYPLYMAAMQGFKEMADFLYPKSDFGSWTEQEKINLLTKAIGSKLYGLAKSIVEQHKFAMHEDRNGEAPLLVLARDPLAFRCIRQGIWAKIMRNDTDGNNLLHLAGTLTPQAKKQLNCIPGAALQMQREVLWFKEVEKLVPLSYKNKKNKEGQTPHELFLAEHEGLMKNGEKFMKQTAKACTLVTMLIATVVFTTAFTVPDSYDNITGHPILENKRLFKVFPVSEAVATLSSLTSMLMFMSILTSRYSDDDFLKTLPFWLVVGVASLFVSIVAMMVAFCSCLLFLEHGWVEVTLLLGFFASVPTIFLVLNYPSLVAILHGTFSCTWLFRSYHRLH